MSITHEPLRYAHDEGHTDICFSSDGSKFITCGADGDIRIWAMNESEDPVNKCVGEWALCVRQKGDNLYVSTGSNDIQILNYPEGERNGVLDRFVAPINCIAVNNNSDYIALAGEDMEVKLVNLKDGGDTTNKITIFGGLSGPCLSVALCPTSKLLAASSGDGHLRIWDVESKALLKEFDCFPKVNSFSNAKKLCRIDFEPVSGALLAYPHHDSVVILNTLDWSQVHCFKYPDATADFSLVQFSPCGKFIVGATTKGEFVVFDMVLKSVHAASKHPNSTAVTGLAWNPLKTGEIVYTDAEGQFGIMSGCIAKEETTNGDEFEDNEVNFDGFQFESDDGEDNENVISVEKIKKQVLGENSRTTSFDEGSLPVATPRPRTPEIPQQSAFMPSSTPEHLNPRYMCWNEVGIIRSYGNLNSEESDKTIEVEFHDSSYHNSIMIQNFHDYSMGVIHKSAFAVANSNQIYVVPLSTDSKEWILKVDDDQSEEIILISTSENLVCFATNKYFVRACSIYGTQIGVISVPGPIVSITCFKNSLLVAYHLGSVRKNDQCLGIKLVTFNGFTVESQELYSALSPESTLFWLGFSDQGTPALMDSLGMLRLFPKSCNTWIPCCDTSKHLKSPADGFFITAMFESQQAVAGIKCKSSCYPSFTPRPTVCELPLEPPFAESGTEKSVMEMKLFSWSNLKVDNVSKEFTATGLKTFALASKNNLDRRALELMEMIMDPQLINLSMKYALKLNKKKLAEKLMELQSKTSSEDDDNYFNANGKDTSENLYSTPNSQVLNTFNTRKLTLSNKRIIKSNVFKTVEKEKEKPAVESDSQKSDSDVTSVSLDNSVVATPEEPKNPFLKNLKKSDGAAENPISLTDKFAGVKYNESKPNQARDVAEKRKHPESETVRQKEKQRKLDKFMFTPR